MTLSKGKRTVISTGFFKHGKPFEWVFGMCGGDYETAIDILKRSNLAPSKDFLDKVVIFASANPHKSLEEVGNEFFLSGSYVSKILHGVVQCSYDASFLQQVLEKRKAWRLGNATHILAEQTLEDMEKKIIGSMHKEPSFFVRLFSFLLGRKNDG